MNGEVGNGKIESDVDVDDDVEVEASPEDTVVITEDLADIDEMGDTTADLNVEELVAKLDKDGDAARKKEVHRRLEELAEKKREREELDSTFNFNLDDEL